MTKILIIDDSEYMRMVASQILLNEGYEVIEASSGEEGIELSHQNDPDCVMLDLLMPNTDGFKVLEKLRQKRNTIPIIIFSSDIQDYVRKKCFALGAFDFIDKPPDKMTMLKTVKMAIGFGQKGQTLILTDKQSDVLQEMVNIGVGRGAELLNAILDTHIKLEVPFIRILSQTEFKKDIKINEIDSLAAVNLSFTGDINGNIELIFPKQSALNLVAALTGENPDAVTLDTIRTGTLSEIGNIVINAIIGSISNMMSFSLSYSAPNYLEGNYEKLSLVMRTDEQSIILQARARFIIETFAVIGDIVIFMELDSFDKIFSIIDQVDDE